MLFFFFFCIENFGICTVFSVWKWCMSMYVWRIWMYPYLFVKSIYMVTVWHYRFHHYVEISHQFNSARYKGINVKFKVRQWLKGLKSSISQWNQLNCTLWFLTNQINTNKKVKQMRNFTFVIFFTQRFFFNWVSCLPHLPFHKDLTCCNNLFY